MDPDEVTENGHFPPLAGPQPSGSSPLLGDLPQILHRENGGHGGDPALESALPSKQDRPRGPRQPPQEAP